MNLLLQLPETLEGATSNAPPEMVRDVINLGDSLSYLPWYDWFMLVALVTFLLGGENKLYGVDLGILKSVISIPLSLIFFTIGMGGRFYVIRQNNQVAELRNKFEVANARDRYAEAKDYLIEI